MIMNEGKAPMDDESEEEEVLGEIELKVEPRIDKLEELGVTVDELSDAIEAALDKEERMLDNIENPDDICPIEEVPVELNGKIYKLEEVAEIEVSGDLDVLF
ncbi:hypothetical protein Pla110_38940 [Polystyrenella longa]|uniref:Uncharacterized protein n=1 Tax=Polystyrenella longa TaxID=2528007 RepID=A0A518CSC1_9PLAN|nr:hypothetical protein [Polystyrenella longa]QDU82139.1 hypothetical protein Pla110_38940 [Polystyrenella longa]